MGLVKDQGVDIPEPRMEKIKGVVDDRYIFNLSQKIAGVIPHDPEPAQEQEQEQEIPHEQEHDIPQHSGTFEFSSFSTYMTQYE
jgi:hypothetical protein